MRILHYSAFETPNHHGMKGGSLKVAHQLYQATLAAGHEAKKLSGNSLDASKLTLQEYRKKYNFDIVVVNADNISELYPVVYNLQPPFVFYQHWVGKAVYPPIIYHPRVACLAPSYTIASNIHKKFIGFPPAIDLEQFYPVPHSLEADPQIGFVSRLTHSKINIEALTQLLKLNNVHIAGFGELSNVIQHSAASYIGNLEYEEVPSFLQSLDIFVYPTYNDSFGLVLLEAQACGLPVVTFDVGGVSDAILHGETGYLVNSVAEFIQKVTHLRQDTAIRSKMSANAYLFASYFDIKMLANKFDNILSSICQCY